MLDEEGRGWLAIVEQSAVQLSMLPSAARKQLVETRAIREAAEKLAEPPKATGLGLLLQEEGAEDWRRSGDGGRQRASRHRSLLCGRRVARELASMP